MSFYDHHTIFVATGGTRGFHNSDGVVMPTWWRNNSRVLMTRIALCIDQGYDNQQVYILLQSRLFVACINKDVIFSV